MSNRLTNKVAVVTGGASGIGAATSRLFLAEGARVVIADLNKTTDTDLINTIEEVGRDHCLFIQTDVTNEEHVKAAVDLAVTTWGHLNAAVACAGVPGQGSDIELEESEWNKIMDVNAKGVFFVTKHAVPEMIKVGGGSIINISSVYGVVGAPGFAAYCASKGAVRTFTKSTAIEHAQQGIRANSIHPGVTETPMLQGIFDRSENPEETRAASSAQLPNGENASPEDVAWGCVYLASDESRFLNGVELPIDGGILAR